MAKNTIKHKLWGKLKRQARMKYKIFPVENSSMWEIKVLDSDCYLYWGYGSFIGHKPVTFNTIEEAQDYVENARQIEFHALCNKALYERRCEKVNSL
jgi:hypothetical protein